MLQSGNEKACIDVAILAEGYTEKEMDVFYQDAQRTCESLFSYEPFRSMKSKFNILFPRFDIQRISICHHIIIIEIFVG